MLPSVKECFNLMEKYRMLTNIKEHSIVVAKVAKIIARGLNNAGIKISLQKVIAGALLHDIGKTPSLQSGGDHSKIGANICLENGFKEIAEIVREHVRLVRFDVNDPPDEREVVFYADKRVNHNKVVPLEERLAYVIKRYTKSPHEPLARAIKDNFVLCKTVEKKLFKFLPFSPHDLSNLVKDETLYS